MARQRPKPVKIKLSIELDDGSSTAWEFSQIDLDCPGSGSEIRHYSGEIWHVQFTVKGKGRKIITLPAPVKEEGDTDGHQE